MLISRRHLKVALLIGVLAAVLVAALFELGAFRGLESALMNFLGVRAEEPAPRAVQYPVFALLALGVAWVTVDVPRNSLRLMLVAGVLAELLAAPWVAALTGHFFSPFAPLAAVLLSAGAAFAYAQGETGSRKRVVRELFGNRISEKTFAQLVDSQVPLHFEGEVVEATVVVCEIFNHDELSETLPVTDYVAMNNSFLRNAADFLVERGAYLDECDGETLRVVFGTPLPDARHAATACAAVLDLQLRLEEVNRECFRVWKKTFDYRLGINSGDMVVAAYGSPRLGAFSVAGEAVEWARRLCAANLLYGARILIGANTFQGAEEEIEVRPMELVIRHAGDRTREELYELLAPKAVLSEEDLERRDAFWQGIICFRERRWDAALAHFRLAVPPGKHDAPLEYFLHRVEQLRGGAPTALDWAAGRI